MSGMSIYGALVRAGMTAAGACGLMGNMQAESGMKSNIVQRGMTALSDGEYTRRAVRSFAANTRRCDDFCVTRRMCAPRRRGCAESMSARR